MTCSEHMFLFLSTANLPKPAEIFARLIVRLSLCYLWICECKYHLRVECNSAKQ